MAEMLYPKMTGIPSERRIAARVAEFLCVAFAAETQDSSAASLRSA
jgi:hypothetical protein